MNGLKSSDISSCGLNLNRMTLNKNQIKQKKIIHITSYSYHPPPPQKKLYLGLYDIKSGVSICFNFNKYV